MNKVINYFFEDMEEYEVYKPYIKTLAILGTISLVITMLIKFA